MFTYTPVFFVRTWPAYKSTFALLNAIALTVLGFSSALLGGMICDKYEERNPMIKAQVLMAGNLATIPLTAIACWTQSFYVAMVAFAAIPFACGSQYAPAITMMQNSVSSENSGIVVSTVSLFTSFAAILSPMIFSRIATYYGAAANPRVYGKVILLAISIGYAGSSIFYYRGGKRYVKMIQDRKKKQALDEAMIVESS